MEIIRPGININFIGKKSYALAISGLLILISIISLMIHKGPRYGVDFAGGILIQIKFSETVTAADIKKNLVSVDLQDSLVQEFEEKGQHEFLIQSSKKHINLDTIENLITTALHQGFGENSFEVRRVETVGPKVGKDLRRKGFLSVIFACILMLLYIAWRFQFRFGVGSIIALVHDVVITLGALSITNREITLPLIAAFLTIIGYSINDTIIVYDRIRENRRKSPQVRLPEIINKSINETLSRTIITSGTLIMVLLALFFLGGGVIHDFAFALLIGAVVGTYSSIYVASPILIFWEDIFTKKSDMRKRSVKKKGKSQ